MPEAAVATPEVKLEGSAPTAGSAFSLGDFFDVPTPQPAAAPVAEQPKWAMTAAGPTGPTGIVEGPDFGGASSTLAAGSVGPTGTPGTLGPDAHEDPFEAALRETAAPAAEPTWDDAAKAVFKSTFGVEDPAAFKETFAKAEAELGTLREANEKQKWAIDLLGELEQKYPALAAAIVEAQEERDPFEYLSQLGDPKMLGKKAEELTDSQKADTYLKKYFSKEERDAIRTGDYTGLDVTEKEVKAKLAHWMPTADAMHNEKNAAHTKAAADKMARIGESRKAQEASVTAAIAKASADPFVRNAITPEILTAFRNGTLFNGNTFKDDGTYADSALSTYLKGQRYDSDIKRAIEWGKKQGARAGEQEVVASLSTSPGASRATPPTPAAPAQPNKNAPFVGISEFLS